MFRKLATLLAALGLSIMITDAANAGSSMTNKQVRALFPGTFSAVVQSVSVRLVASRSGSLKGYAYGMVDRGRWSVRRGVLCIVLKKWMDGKPRCSRVSRSGRWYRVASVKFRRL